MKSFETGGFEIIRGVFDATELDAMRAEADRVAEGAGSACVRHLRAKSVAFDELAVSERLSRILPKGLSPVRSILFDKTPNENWPVAWHQDLTIAVKEKVEVEGYGPWSIKDGSAHVQPPVELLKQMVTVRIHLDNTPQSNGALRVIPKSPEKGKIPSTEVLSHVDSSEVICECDPGDVLLMSPLLLHASRRSESPSRRRVIHFEYAPLNSLDERLSWHEPMKVCKRATENKYNAR